MEYRVSFAIGHVLATLDTVLFVKPDVCTNCDDFLVKEHDACSRRPKTTLLFWARDSMGTHPVAGVKAALHAQAPFGRP
jgi:hypothetical protein